MLRLPIVAFAVLTLASCGDGGGVHGFPKIDEAAQDAVCSTQASTLAPGMTYGAGQGLRLVSAALTAAQVSALLAQQGDKQDADYWRDRPSGTLVYSCAYNGPAPTIEGAPGPCPAGQDPVVDGIGSQRTFFVDATGHATEDKLAPPEPTGRTAGANGNLYASLTKRRSARSDVARKRRRAGAT